MSKQILIKKYQKEYANEFSLHFDGSNDYVSLPNLGISGNTSITLEAWVKFDTVSTDQSIIFFGNETNLQTANLKLNTNATATFSLFGVANLITSTFTLKVNTWYHLAGTYNSSNQEIVLYINGRRSNSATAGTANFNNSGYAIGRRTAGTVQPTDGYIAEARIWNVVRTQQEISENMSASLAGTESGLLAYYKLNSSSGTTATDTTGSFNGTLTNFTGAFWENVEPPVYVETYQGFHDNFDSSTFLTTLNSGYGDQSFTLPEKFDNVIAGITTENGLVKVYSVSNSSEVLLYVGEIDTISRSAGNNDRTVITSLGVINRIANTPLLDTDGSYNEQYASMDLSDMLKSIIYSYNSQNPILPLNYTSTSIETTGKVQTITFFNSNCLDGIKTIFKATDNDWVWYIDGDSTVYLKQISTTPDYLFTVDKDIVDIQVVEDKNKIINNVLIWNGQTGGSSISRRYKNQDSIDTYGLKTTLIRDGRYSASYMDEVGTKIIADNATPNIFVSFILIDSTAGGFAFDELKVGDTFKINNQSIPNLPELLVISKIENKVDTAVITAQDRFDFVSRELADLKNEQFQANYADAPDNYTLT